MTVKITAMQEKHLDQAYLLTQKLKWPHRREDWQQAWQLGEGVVAEQNGKVLGTVICWRWGQDYASTGLVIVADEAQGQGIGTQLMQAVLHKLPGVNVRLHATEMGQGLYEKLGFVAIGQVRQHQTPELAKIAPVMPEQTQRLRQASADDLTRMVALDTQAHGQCRSALIHYLLHHAQRNLLLEEQGIVQGFASLRRFGHGFLIGPVICRDLAAAKVLVSTLLMDLEGQFVRMDTPDQALSAWLNACGLHEVDGPVAMIRGVPWQPSGMLTFGLMSQAMA